MFHFFERVFYVACFGFVEASLLEGFFQLFAGGFECLLPCGVFVAEGFVGFECGFVCVVL